ncbi:MAG: FliM/FliN family flagellar motor switch protein, partial [Nitrospinota bacterium]
EILKFSEGNVIELNKLVGEPMEIFINGLLTARGEVVVVNERFGIRVTDVIDPMELIRDL